MAAWIVCALCALVIIKPQEFVPALAGLPLLYIAFALALFCIVLDVAYRTIRLALAPQTPFLFAFFAWALVTTVVKAPDSLAKEAIEMAILAGIYLAVSTALASHAGLRAFAMTFFACGMLVGVVAVVQYHRPFGCFIGEADDWEGKGELAYDGRPCESVLDCLKDAPDPNGNYRCEHVGPLNTSSIGGRVRYRGSLADPNELSLMLAVAAPLALVLAELRKRSSEGPPSARESRPSFPPPPLLSDGFLSRVAAFFKATPFTLSVSVMAYAVILSQSRSGLLSFLLVLGLYFIRKVGVWGVVAGCLVAPPMLLFGGRSGAEAESSSDERAELLREAFEFIRNTKGIGLGLGRFSDESSIGLTAHNAYMLAATETGIVGYFLFGFLMYLSLKVPFAIWFGHYRKSTAVRRFAPAIAISLSGAVAGVFFLSWTYKDILYMLMGASAALYGAAKADDPRVRVRFSFKEALYVTGGLCALIVVIYVGARLHK